MKNLLNAKRGNEIISGFAKSRVLVIGDLIMDHFIWGSVERISPEAPVPVVDVKDEEILLGGSANVVNNIRSLGGKCFITGVAGKDDDGKKLFELLHDRKVPTDGIVIDKSRQTTIKTRIVAGNQQVVRFDRESREFISEAILKKVVSYVSSMAAKIDVIVISDYDKGLISADMLTEIMKIARKHDKKVAVDPKMTHFDYYEGVNIITPNNKEASDASGIKIKDEDTLREAAENLRGRTAADALLITRGEHGMSLYEGKKFTHIPTVAKEVYDVSGAGDTVIGVLALALGAGATYTEASVLANFAAGVVVGKLGTATLNTEELKEALKG